MYFQFVGELNLIEDIIEIGLKNVDRNWAWKNSEAIIYVAAKEVWTMGRRSGIKSFVDNMARYDVRH